MYSLSYLHLRHPLYISILIPHPLSQFFSFITYSYTLANLKEHTEKTLNKNHTYFIKKKAMKISCGCVALLVIALLCLPAVTPARHIGRPRTRHGHRHSSPKEVAVGNPNFYREIRATKSRGPDTVQIAGSSLPDCSHACGSCSPCRLVMVSFVCASLEEAETCPMAYKCMCRNKSYPVP